LGNLNATDYFEERHIDGRITQWISIRQGGQVWTRFNWLRTGFNVGHFELENDNSGSIQGGEILEEFNDYTPFKEDPRKLS
jgi:hypothetical protein